MTTSKQTASDDTSAERDRHVLRLYEQLLEIEQRLIPTGLHVFGSPSQPAERIDMLRMIASFDRPEAGARALPSLVAEGLGIPLSEPRPMVTPFTEEQTRQRELIHSIITDALSSLQDQGVEAAIESLSRKANVPADNARPVFTLLAKVSRQLESNNEIDALARALRGEYVLPGPGADIVQNPSILPTGRNTHAINPYSVPSALAFTRAETVVDNLLARYQSEHGRYPRAMALVLWGLDNIKTQGEGVAQALWLLGVRPVSDSLNRITAVEPIPLAELGRPRIDVVMTISGIFRDLFSPTVQLLDKAVRLVAQLDEPEEMNYLRRHVNEQISSDNCDRGRGDDSRIFQRAWKLRDER